MNLTIKPLADGFALYDGDKYIMWCHSIPWAEHRKKQYEAGEIQ